MNWPEYFATIGAVVVGSGVALSFLVWRDKRGK